MCSIDLKEYYIVPDDKGFEVVDENDITMAWFRHLTDAENYLYELRKKKKKLGMRDATIYIQEENK